MIDKKEIDTKAAEFNIGEGDVQKDYVYGWMLKGIFEHPVLGKIFSLKGGAALRKAYFAESRFSKDLDFSVAEAIDPDLLRVSLNEVCAFVAENTGVLFNLDATLVKDKGLPIGGRQVLEARAYFKSFYGEWEAVLKTQVDVTQFDKHYLPLQNPSLLHPYSDKDACATVLVCQKAEEIFASKLVALLHRRKAKDLFDLTYGLVIQRDPPVNRLEVATTFLKRSIYEPSPAEGKRALLEVPIEETRGSWGEVTAPARTIFSFDQMAGGFNELIEGVFAHVLVPAPIAPLSGGYAPPRTIWRPMLSVSRHGIHPRPVTVPSYSFGISSGIRNTIVNAGRSRTLVELGYDGYRRMVEPYKLEYATRADGRGAEYFWGYDRSGGKSGKVSIKRFFANQIEYAHSTATGFAPQWPIEL